MWKGKQGRKEKRKQGEKEERMTQYLFIPKKFKSLCVETSKGGV